ncbi:phosphatase PAP2 family protein [Methyloversatilis sp.]|uniref:phosphatase PAP2 family protein n=1 Tax=Methyloversatilis sp. TaxID=2569862 RepID=UPI00273698A5|nr:phosphatase PAP2 family protein [Methyloversatilis sp.]MDP2870168.1 phosphatase PAP2 family protein [Methyloversatilis sp.]MDP3289782.1 phosphatase PAP2 family protein [Methyloversatilis sp.]MDP3456053.1 phosphatase PAP2 family protein [Methyloversatilis sp.]MDP3580236.1 phosphatase PAP2 family protein [Methyloversatilis sp.]
MSGFDLWLSAHFFDATAGGFALRRDWLWSVLLHDGVKWLSVAAWLALLAYGFALSLRARESDRRARVAFVLCASLAAVVAVNLLRMKSAHSCPWYLVDFGGQAQFFRLFDEVPPNSGPGKCLPSGHAASAFMWLALLPVVRGVARQRALFAVLTLGALAGAVQVVRGAHFPSHILLAAAACAIVVLGLASVMRPPAG